LRSADRTRGLAWCRLDHLLPLLFLILCYPILLLGHPLLQNKDSSLDKNSPSAYTPTPAAVLTQRYDNDRTGANFQEYVLTTASVASPDFQLLYSIPVSGQIYAQPLIVPRTKWPDGSYKNVLVVATMMNTVSAFQVDDAIYGPSFSPTQLWSITLGPSVAANFMPMAFSTQTCFIICVPNSSPPSTVATLPPIGVEGPGLYNINPVIGVVSTPVVDSATNTIYAVSKLVGSTGAIENHLFSIDLLTGRINGTVRIDATASPPGGSMSSDSVNGVITFDHKHQMQRPALLMLNGVLYIAFGSHQDTSPWHGWVLAYNPTTLQQTASWCSTPNGMGGAIWQAGSGLASAADGNIYFMTGNGEKDPPGSSTDTSFDPTKMNFANMFVQLSSGLTVLGSFAPGDEAQREGEDTDLGSAGPIHIPNTTILLGGDKESKIFVLDTTNKLGVRQIFQAGAPLDGFSVGGSGWHHIHGTPPVWRNSQNKLTLYVWPERDYLRAFSWNDANSSFDCRTSSGAVETCQDGDRPIQQSNIQAPGACGTCFGSMPGGILSVSSDGERAGTGVLWASIPINDNGLNNVVSGVLRAFDAEDITMELWNSQVNSARDGSFMFAKFNPPVVANGRVYLATFGSIPSGGIQSVSGSVNIYGMRQWAKYLSAGGYPLRVRAGARFTAYATFMNVGTTVWKQGVFRLGSQSPQDNTKWGTNRIDLPADISPGGQVALQLNLTAPADPAAAGCSVEPNGAASCTYQWRMVQEGVEWFGESTAVATIQIFSAPKLTLVPPAGTDDDLGKRKITVFAADPITGASVNVTVYINGVSGNTGSAISYPGCVSLVPQKHFVPCPGSVTVPGYSVAEFSD
jgi:hypothetical protein